MKSMRTATTVEVTKDCNIPAASPRSVTVMGCVMTVRKLMSVAVIVV